MNFSIFYYYQIFPNDNISKRPHYYLFDQVRTFRVIYSAQWRQRSRTGELVNLWETYLRYFSHNINLHVTYHVIIIK